MAQRFSVDMGMYAPQAFQPPRTKSIPGQIRDHDSLIAPNDHVFHIAPPSNEEGYLSVKLKGNLGNSACHLTRNYFVLGDALSVDVLESS